MLSQAQIKYIRALQQKKYRKLHGSFVVEGEKIVAELLRSHYHIAGIFALEEWISRFSDGIPGDVGLTRVSPTELSRISGLTTPNQVVAVVSLPDQSFHTATDWNGLALYLDGIQDPGNLGTIIRTADWFGIDLIGCSPDTADIYNPKVIQATMGSFLRVRVIRATLSAFLGKVTKKPVIYGTSLEGENLFSSQFPESALVIIGNESKGISADLRPLIDKWIQIPGKGQGAESLNASVAAAIVMAWHSKQ